MTTLSDDPHASCRERLSALMDGELAGPTLHQACGHWREAEASRSAWHLYHVIGDVLRSDDLAHGVDRNAVFLQSLRVRMSAEPVVLAPVPPAAPRPLPDSATGVPSSRRREAWRRPATIAAGFVAVAGIVLLVRVPAPGAGAGAVRSYAALPVESLASRAVAFVPTGAATVVAEPRSLAPGDPLIRDAQLDRYLAAHQQFVGSSALGVPSGFLRAATVEPVRR